MSLEMGRTTKDERVHGIRVGLGGPVAACGAGVITERIPGRFDGAVPLACAECAAVASAGYGSDAPPVGG